ncbi:MAG: GNAT family N-acetyltransferase [Vampirovibrionia bacterium]|jgi:glucosamine-phosphate N-acetyltransferase
MKLLNEFRETSLTQAEFSLIYRMTKSNSEVWLLINDDNSIVGSATILYEHKFIHNGGIVGHIEDLVIKESCRGRGHGKYLLEFLRDRSEKKGCYKIVLNSEKNTEKFYKKAGFSEKNSQFEIRF